MFISWLFVDQRKMYSLSQVIMPDGKAQVFPLIQSTSYIIFLLFEEPYD